jgi:hypothetical protein
MLNECSLLMSVGGVSKKQKKKQMEATTKGRRHQVIKCCYKQLFLEPINKRSNYLPRGNDSGLGVA